MIKLYDEGPNKNQGYKRYYDICDNCKIWFRIFWDTRLPKSEGFCLSCENVQLTMEL